MAQSLTFLERHDTKEVERVFGIPTGVIPNGVSADIWRRGPDVTVGTVEPGDALSNDERTMVHLHGV